MPDIERHQPGEQPPAHAFRGLGELRALRRRLHDQRFAPLGELL
jgi:hypothetical protein